MILGIGTDLVDSRRMESWLQSFDNRRLGRVFHPAELAMLPHHPNPRLFLASRFAAKEALAKAFGTGIGRHLRLRDICVTRAASGQPSLELHGQSLQDATARLGNGFHLHLSLSTEDPFALAFVVLASHP
ncbi:MAG: holo-[acyl-carrier-protein] synthase [Alphaproteobacteria bacterium]|nr:holo-[acyl-carrier-protein] synthase [Alphaproteobacteria bacterium]